MTTPYEKAKAFSKEAFNKIRDRVPSVVPSDTIVIACGSFARREASELSDLDYFAVLPGNAPPVGTPNPSWLDSLENQLKKIVPKTAAEDGAFKKIDYREEMLRNIGGNQDTNPKISRRVLLLLEGDWLADDAGFRTLRHEILERYIRDTITDHQLALFLLNDIIRYYRTVCVDYEFKTEESSKPWAIRNIKLTFSRKLLYASGVFSVAMTADAAHDQKIEQLERLFGLPVVERMIEICGSAPMERVLACYNRFLEKIEDPTIRAALDKLPHDRTGRDDTVFRTLKNEGHHFTRHILALFESTFGSVHPIRRAVIF